MSGQWIAVGTTFRSFKNFHDRFDNHTAKSKHKYSIVNSKNIATFAAGRSFNPNLKYYVVNYSCIYGGVFKSKSKGIRQTSSRRQDCPASITLHADKDRQVLKVTRANFEHNHQALRYDTLNGDDDESNSSSVREQEDNSEMETKKGESPIQNGDAAEPNEDAALDQESWNSKNIEPSRPHLADGSAASTSHREKPEIIDHDAPESSLVTENFYADVFETTTGLNNSHSNSGNKISSVDELNNPQKSVNKMKKLLKVQHVSNVEMDLSKIDGYRPLKKARLVVSETNDEHYEPLDTKSHVLNASSKCTSSVAPDNGTFNEPLQEPQMLRRSQRNQLRKKASNCPECLLTSGNVPEVDIKTTLNLNTALMAKRQDVIGIKIPEIKGRGRPKGSQMKAIGIPRRRTKSSSSKRR